MPNTLGNDGESAASNYLSSFGFSILVRNFKTPYGELDIVAQKNGEVYFCEVKTRSSAVYGEGVEAVDYKKRQKIRDSAMFYLSKYSPFVQFHFLVISVILQNNKLEIDRVEEIEEF